MQSHFSTWNTEILEFTAVLTLVLVNFCYSMIDAQVRIQNARILVCGLTGLHVEVVKNSVLAGMNIVIQDSTTVCVKDLSHNFFVSSADIGRNVRSYVFHDFVHIKFAKSYPPLNGQ